MRLFDYRRLRERKGREFPTTPEIGIAFGIMPRAVEKRVVSATSALKETGPQRPTKR
jgi:hypothetical protein